MSSSDKPPADSKKYRMCRLGLLMTGGLGVLATIAVMMHPNIEPAYFIALAACFGALGLPVSTYCIGQAWVDKTQAGKG